MKIFDQNFYKITYPDYIKQSAIPFAHYIRYGWKRGYNPSPNFNTNYYLLKHPEVIKSGISPIEHFEIHGNKKKPDIFPDLAYFSDGKNPHLVDIAYYFSVLAGLFDPQIYCEEIEHNLDCTLLEHFKKNGANNKYKISSFFDVNLYKKIFALNNNSQNPLIHFMMETKDQQQLLIELSKDQIREKVIKVGLFNSDYYISTYPEIRHVPDPFINYMIYGWRLGWNPSPLFNTQLYLHENPACRTNPLFYLYKSGNRLSANFGEIDFDKFPTYPGYMTAHIGDILIYKLEKNGLFDDEWYRNRYHDVELSGMTPRLHYRRIGYLENKSPSKYINIERFVDYPDLKNKQGVILKLINSDFDMFNYNDLWNNYINKIDQEKEELLLQNVNTQRKVEGIMSIINNFSEEIKNKVFPPDIN